jgi:hypothetical protein
MRAMLLLPETCPRSAGRACGGWCWLLVLTAFGLLSGSPAAGQASSPAACTKWEECRTLALDAEARGEFETFHDYAWRTMQTRGKVDPEVMTLLARAQARSGRPHDALVMLRRITELDAAPTEALEDQAFERTRALPGWPAVQEAIVQRAAAKTGLLQASPAAGSPAVSAAASATAGDPSGQKPRRASAPAPVTEAPAASVAPGAILSRRSKVEDLLNLSARGINPAGLAYDAASARVLVADGPGRRIITISERLKTAVDLVRAESAGFHDVQALAVDARQGDLWVTSATSDGGAGSSAAAPAASLHKLQLVSGRPLLSLGIDVGDEPARLTGLAVIRNGAVFVLDANTGRLWRHIPRSTTLTLLASLPLPSPRALAVDDDAAYAFVAHENGLSRVTLKGNAVAESVTGPPDSVLGALEHLTWQGGTLAAIDRGADGKRRLVRLRLGRRGTGITAVDVLDPDVLTCADTSALSVSGRHVYYLAAEAIAGECTLIVRRASLE